VEELKEAMGEMILLDGIPMLLFLSEYTREELEEFTKKILKLFSPNLILGISDEISPPGDIEKVEFVSQVVEEWNGERR
jgi:uroporphyrinogen-III decarboxylase